MIGDMQPTITARVIYISKGNYDVLTLNFCVKIFTVGQLVLLDYTGSNYTLSVIETVVEQSEVESSRGLVTSATSCFLEPSPSSGIKVQKVVLA
jgi:hypothetical protein